MNTENDKDRRPRVFLVDDQECMLRTVERILGHGCSVVGNAPNGALAIEEVLRLQPDIVIMLSGAVDVREQALKMVDAFVPKGCLASQLLPAIALLCGSELLTSSSYDA